MKLQVSFSFLVLTSRVFSGGWRYCHFIILLFLGFTSSTSAQNKVWDKTIGGNFNEVLIAAKQTPDGGYILAGSSASNISGDKTQNNQGKRDRYRVFTTDYWVVKLNADGSKAWDKTFGGADYDDLKSLILTADGGYLLGGTSASGVSGNKTAPDKGWSDYWLVKIDAAGNKQWEKTYGGSRPENLASLEATSDGGYIMGGTSSSGITGDKTAPKLGGNDFWVVKIKADGTKEWDKTYGSKSDDYLSLLATSPDGGFLLNGSIYEQGYQLLKVKPDGNIAWQKEFIEATRIQTTKNGEIVVGYGFGDYNLLKLKADGTQIWDKRFGADQLEILSALEQTQDGGYILGGYSTSGISGDKTEGYKGACTVDTESCDEDYWIIKVKADGTKEWDRALGGDFGDRLTSIQQTADKGYIVGGISSSNLTRDKSQNSKGVSDYWVLKLDNTVRQNQTVTFGESALLTRTIGDAPFALEATSSSELPVSFRVVSGPATVQGNQLTVTGADTVHIQAYQSGNAQYNATVTDLFIPVEAKPAITKQWDRTLGGFNQEALLALIPTSDGGYLAGGYSESGKTGDKSSTSQGGNDFWITKLNNQGAKLWDKAYGGNQADNLRTLLATPDGGFLLGGTSNSGNSGDKSQASKGGSDYWLVKIDATGNKLWDKTYGGNQDDQLTALIATPDGGFLLGGTSNSGNSGDKSEANKGGSDYWILKIDASGTKLWDKTYGGTETDRLGALALVPGGGYLVGGTSASNKSGDKSEDRRGQEDYWVLRLQENGSIQWNKTLGGVTENYIYDECFEDDPAKCQVALGSSVLTALFVTPDGHFLIGGYSDAEQGGDKTDKNIGGNSYTRLSDYWVVKLNNKGTKVWDKTYGGIRSEKVYDIGTYLTGDSELAAITATPDGNYLLAGTSNSDKGGDKSENASGGEKYLYRYNGELWRGKRSERDYWILKINDAGTRQWDRTIGSRDDDVLGAVVPTSGTGYLLGGTSNGIIGDDKTEAPRDTADSPFEKRGDFWLVQVQDETPPPTANWNMRYGGSGTDNFTDVIKTADGGYLSAGYSESNISGDKTQYSQGRNDYWIVKSDKDGLKQWEKSYGGAKHDYLNRVIQTQDDGYLLAGSSFSGKSGDKTEAAQGGRDYWLVKIDKQGNKQWDKTIGGSGHDELEKVIQLSTGEYVLGGYSNSPVSGDKTQASQGSYDYWLVKINSTGTKIWDKRYGGTSADKLGGFTQTRDGGFFLGGGSNSGKGGDKTQPSRGDDDYWAVKTDKDGNLLWEKTYGGNGQDYAISVRQSDGDNLYLAGYSASGANGDKSQASQGGRDFWLVKVDETGKKLWDKRFGGDKDDNLSASTYTEQGHYLLAGTSYSGANGDKTQTSQGSSDYWVVEVDEQGNLVMDQRAGGSGADELRTVTQTRDGGLLLGGRSDSGVSGDRTQPSQGGTDYWLIKVVSTTSTIAARMANPMEASAAEELTPLTAYPNPFQEQVTVKFTLPKTQAASVRVLDGQGREIATLFRGEAQAKQTYQVKWQASRQAAGMYLLQLQTPTKLNTQKLLLNK